jgi:hypothetical protein
MSDERDLRKQRKVKAEVTIDTAGLATEAKQDTQITLATLLNTYVDGLETLLTSLNTKDYSTEATLIQVRDYLDTVETKLASIITNTAGLSQEATQLLIAGYVDGIEALLTTLNAKDYSTETTLLTRLSKADFEARINTLGQKTKALSTPVVLPSDQTLTVSSTDLDIRNLSEAQDSILIYGKQDGGTANIPIATSINGYVQVEMNQTNVTVTNGSLSDAVNIQDGGNSITVDGEVTIGNNYSTTQTTTTISASTSSVLLKTSNSNRKQITITNTSTKTLWICLFTPATSLTPFYLGKDETWIFDKWIGVIYGIWDTGATGSAHITEETL